MSCFTRSRCLNVVLVALALALPALAADGPAANADPGSPAVTRTEAPPASIVIGFVGGFVAYDNPHHEPVKLARHMRESVPKGAYVQVFENRHRKAAYETILHLLDSDHNGALSEAEKANAHIILLGHSWGASAVVLLARELRRVGIPVLLTVQVDSVTKPWQHDGVIPDNVAEAVNFHQPHGIIHGRAQITAADPTKTQILGNYLFDYKKHPVQCPENSWAYRTFTGGHAQSECDPHLWSQVEDLIRQHLQPQSTTATALRQP